jgi:hypothetical protein
MATNTVLGLSIFEALAAFFVELHITDIFKEEWCVMYHTILTKIL